MTVSFKILIACFIITGCSAPKTVSRVTKQGSLQTSSDGSKTQEPLVKKAEVALSGLPPYCSVNSSENQKVCIACNRPGTDASVTVDFKDLCFTARPDFDAKLHCGSDGEGNSRKSIFCSSAEEKTVSFDVSLASERASEVIPFILVAIKSSLSEKLKDDADTAKAADEFIQFIGDRLPVLLSGRDLETITNDLVLLIGKHVATPLSDVQKETIRTQMRAAITTFYKDLANSKDLSMRGVVESVLKIARTVPDGVLGKAKPFLNGPALAELLEQQRSVIEPDLLEFGSFMGLPSFDELLAQIKSVP